MTDRLLVDIGADGRVLVSRWLDGEVPSRVGEPLPLAFPLDTNELEELRWYVEEYLRAPFGVYEQRGTDIADRLPEWGQRLFESVFGTGSARDAFVGLRSRAMAASSAVGPRPEILFISSVPAWLGLPWELARDGIASPPLALSGMEILRSLPMSLMNDAFPVPGERLRVLMVISRPRGAGDVGYRMIARPLLERLTAVSGQVDVVVLRPPTLQALVDTLAEARASGQPFQVVHFDGHGFLAGKQASGVKVAESYLSAGEQGVLVFEKPGGGPDQVPAERVAQVLAEGRVPVVVLNACQSGAIGKDLEATVATRLLSAGASSVVAMAYSVYAVAAAEFMTAFYERLFAGDPVSAAVNAGRARLARNSLRPSPKGDLPLADWLVPVHYLRRDVHFPQLRVAVTLRGELSIDDFLDQARSRVTATLDPHSDPLVSAGRFVGRDGLFYDLEVAARLQKVVVLYGPAGTGKTELAKAFGRWWRETGGVDNPDWVIWHSFQPGIASFGLDGVLSKIGLQVFGADYARVPTEDRRGVIMRLLAERRLLLLLDNFESVVSMPDSTAATPPLDEPGRGELLDFLTKVSAGGQSAVLVTSRSPEPWLGDLRRITVGGLSAEEANEYADQLLEPFPAAATRRQERAFGELMQWLDGHPLSMRLTLPRLDTTDPSTLLHELLGLGPLPGDEDARADRSTSLSASITYSITHLTPDIRRRLVAVSLFHGVTDANVLAIFSQDSQVPARFGDTSTEQWTELLNAAAQVGLLTPLSSGTYGLHPALPAYLARDWRTEDPNAYDQQRVAATAALLDAYAAFGEWLEAQIGTGDAGFAFALIDQQRRTLGYLLGHALNTSHWQQAHAIARPLHAYWEARGMFTEATVWVDRARLALENADGTPPALDGAAGNLWLFLVGAQANHELSAGEFDAAERTYQQILQMLMNRREDAAQQGGFSTTYHQLGALAHRRGRLQEAADWYRQSLSASEAVGDRLGMAGTYHHLGIVAHQRGRLEEAEDWFRQSLSIAEDVGDLTRMATSYFHLGRVAQDRGLLEGAEDWYSRSLTILENLGDLTLIATAYHQLGFLNYMQGFLEEAEGWCRRSLIITEDLEDRPGIAKTYGLLGLLAEARGHAGEALDWTVQCVTLFDQFPHPATDAGPTHMARLTAALGVDALRQSWLRATSRSLPLDILAFVQSRRLPEE